MPTLQTNKREGSVRIRAKKDGTLSVEQDWFFRIKADNISQSRVDILITTPDVPKFGVIYSGLRLSGCDATRLDEDPLLWDAVYNLSNQVTEGENVNPSDGSYQLGTPTDWVPVVELGFEDYEEVFLESLPLLQNETDASADFTFGDPPAAGTETDGLGYNAARWVNSAGQPYDQGFVRQRRIITRKFTQFEPITGTGAVTLDTIEARNDTLNDASYLGKAKRTLKLSVDSVAAGFYYGVRCWRVDYTMAYKADDWRLKKLDVGWFYRDADDDNKLKPFLDEPGNNIIGSLNGSGGKAADRLKPAIRAHKEFPSINFASFLRLA
jgi:hypothetical protein